MSKNKPVKKTYVTFVLDETGSMMSIKDDTIGGFNQYLGDLKKSNNPVFFSLLKFDSNRVEKVCIDKPVSEVPELNSDTYRPGAMTPLIDAVMGAIKATEEAVKDKDAQVVVVVQTDGQENASREHSRQALAQKVKEKTEAGWLFTFLGAGIDAWGEAQSLGFNLGNTIAYGRDKSVEAFGVASRATQTFMSTGDVQASAYTKAERQLTGDDSTPDEVEKVDLTG